MRVSVVTPSYNSAWFLEDCLESVLLQREYGTDLEYIVVDGGSTDGSLDIIERYRDRLDRVVVEPDEGPADAINKGLAAAGGDVLAWLNADDRYEPLALVRAAAALALHPDRALCFGHCPIIDEQGREIRRGITRFKECFYPMSGRFTVQCINYVSQPSTFFRRSAWDAAGPLRTDLTAAWDYEFFLRLWRQGGAVRVPGPPLAAFRWHEASISGRNFRQQFKEEWEVAAADAGRVSLQSLLHLGVRAGIVAIYGMMERRRAGKSGAGDRS